MNPTEIAVALAHCEIFKGLDEAAIQKVAGLCREDKFESWDYIFRQGDFGEHLYVIVDGQVLLERTINLGQRKGSVAIGTLGKGRVCGCWSTVLGAPHILMSSATCQKGTTILSIKGSDLRDMMLENTQFGFQILERMCFILRERMQSAYGAMENI